MNFFVTQMFLRFRLWSLSTGGAKIPLFTVGFTISLHVASQMLSTITSTRIGPQLNQFLSVFTISIWSKFRKKCHNFLSTQIVCSSFASKLNVRLLPSSCIRTQFVRRKLVHNSINSCPFEEFEGDPSLWKYHKTFCWFRLFSSFLLQIPFSSRTITMQHPETIFCHILDHKSINSSPYEELEADTRLKKYHKTVC